MTSLCVIATSSYTAVGLTSASSAAAVRSGISSFTEWPQVLDRLGEPAVVAAPPGIMDEREPADAMAAMAAAVFSSLGCVKPSCIILALPEPRPGLSRGATERVANALTALTPDSSVELAGGGGHAAGGVALLRARDILDENPEATVAVLGVDSYLHKETIASLDSSRQLHATYNAWGFTPGAAAGACLLCDSRLAASSGRRVQAFIEAVAVDNEEFPIKSPGVCLGRAMSRIFERLTEDLSPDSKIDAMYCDQNGEPYRADELGFMLARASDKLRNTGSFVAPADCWGDVGSASIPLFLALAIEARNHKNSAELLSLHLAGSESGLRVGLLVKTPERAS